MKKILLSSVFVFSLLATYSCNEEDFLTTEPTETIGNPPADRKVSGVYANLIRVYTAGTTDHEDYGQKGIDVMFDLIQSDVALQRNVYSRYRDIANLASTVDYTSRFNTIPWNYYYKIIYGANDVIEPVDENNFANTIEQHSYGQALALRGYAYFYLLQAYTKEYNPSANGVPLVTTTYQQESPMKSQQEIYDFILADLLKAEGYLSGYNRGSQKLYINQDVVRGLLAYVYSAIGNNDKAAEYSLQVMNSGVPITTTAQLTGGFNDVNTTSWLWGADLTSDMNLNLVSWWGQMDMYTYSYQSVGDYKTIDENLRLSIPTGDIRGTQFQPYPNATAATKYWMPLNKFYDAAKKIQGARTVESDYIFMRVDEFHMLYAESMAKKGNLTESVATLKFLLKNRFSDTASFDTYSAYLDTLGKDELLDEIYKQTRIEFWGEGKSFLAMKRNKKDVHRGANHLANANQTISFNGEALYFKIPQKEVINNPNL